MLQNAGVKKTDVLVVGTGGAGCRAAIEAAEYGADVTLVSKGVLGRSGTTNMAEVVYAAAIGHGDRQDKPRYLFEDTVVEGHWIGDQRLVKLLADESAKTVYDLERYGLPWYRMEDGRHYYQLPTPGHRYDRGVHYNESTGSKMQDALVAEVKRHDDIHPLNDILVVGLMVDDGRIVGASAIDLKNGQLVLFETGAVIVATGGAGMMYQVTDMEHGSTGDGIAMAYRAGAQLIAPEMHQFFPTAFVHPETLRGIIVTSSNLWGFGLRLYNARGERFMERYFPDKKENVPRDVLSRSIFQEILEGRGTEHGGVWLDASNIDGWEYLRRERARSYVWPTKLGVNTERFEIAPTYHFTMGGIRIDTDCQTNVEGLYAAGEVVGGIHGANRIGGNALPECMVFGAIAGRHAALHARRNVALPQSTVKDEHRRLTDLLETPERLELRPKDALNTLKDIMYRHVGIVRSAQGLEEGLEKLHRLEAEDLPRVGVGPGKVFNWEWIWKCELLGMVEQAKLYTQAALMRTETRGAHFRSDFPQTDNVKWLRNIVVQKVAGEVCYQTEPVELSYLNPATYQAGRE
ncbi:MAG: FAD-binding protein [Anaerolineales bacterium]|nr:FAD-binding protein [Anaerolineales bacterium]